MIEQLDQATKPATHLHAIAELTDLLGHGEPPQQTLGRAVAFLADNLLAPGLVLGCVFQDEQCITRTLGGSWRSRAHHLPERLAGRRGALEALFRTRTSVIEDAGESLRTLRELCELPQTSAALAQLVPARNRVWGLLLFLRDEFPAPFPDTDRNLFRAAANIFDGIIHCFAVDNDRRGEVRQAIRAKREWEVTVDALPQVICLLDRDGRVLRANRALVSWGLGSPADVVERDIGEILRPLCARDGGECTFLQRYRQFWRGSDEAVEWESECEETRRVNRIILRRLDHGDEADDFSDESRAVIVVEDVTDQRAAERTLLHYNRGLEEKVRERTKRLIAANEELTRTIDAYREQKAELMESKLELHELSSQLIGAQESERKRIAVELHDSIGQTLSAIKFTVEGLQNRQRRTDTVTEEDRGTLDAVVRRIREAVAEVRRVSMDLRPSMLDDLGLLPTLAWFFREYQSVYGHIRITPVVDLAESDIPTSMRVTAFRIVQEALNNIAKHADAREAAVALRRDEHHIELFIRDDGVGFDPATLRTALRQVGYGLKSMKERAELSGGRFRIVSAPGTGTEITITWPRRSRLVPDLPD